ncbi:MAG: hypothetical protein AAF921_18250 [Cyanobacteria bacterium P01_D01_bin.44]
MTKAPSVPTLAQSTVQVLTPCLPLLLRTETASAIDNGVDQALMSPIAVVSEDHCRLGQSIWEALWPSITADYEAKIAAQEVAKTPNSIALVHFQESDHDLTVRQDTTGSLRGNPLRWFAVALKQGCSDLYSLAHRTHTGQARIQNSPPVHVGRQAGAQS